MHLCRFRSLCRGGGGSAGCGHVGIALRKQRKQRRLPLGRNRELRFRSWDRFRLPWPRAHVAFAFGEPLLFGPDVPDAAELECRRRQLASAIDNLEATMTESVGKRDRYPHAKVMEWRR